MGFRPWGYKMNSPSTGLITEQYSLSLIYYSVYEFFLFFPSGHRFPFFFPLYMNVSKLQNSIATCSATLCNKPALLLSLKWLHWTRVTHCLPSGNLSKCSPRVVSLPIVYQLVAKTPWNWSLHAKTPNQLNHKEITVFFFFLVPRWLLFCFSSEPLALCWGQPRTLTVRIRLHQMSAHPCVGVLPAT